MKRVDNYTDLMYRFTSDSSYEKTAVSNECPRTIVQENCNLRSEKAIRSGCLIYLRDCCGPNLTTHATCLNKLVTSLRLDYVLLRIRYLV